MPRHTLVVQRNQLRELKARYSRLWPDIAAGILDVHRSLHSPHELNDSIAEFVAVHLGEDSEDSVELVYNLDLPEEGYRAYFVPIYEWTVAEVKIAE